MAKLTKHQKDLELAAAGAPKYGVYVTGGDAVNIARAMTDIGQTLLALLTADAAESTKRDALALLKEAVPSVHELSISECNVDMSVHSDG